MATNPVPFTNHYAVLGVSNHAAQQSIQKAFWDLARRYHPDLNHSPLAAERYKQIVDAYQVLRSPDLRRILDERLLTTSCQYLAGDLFNDPPQEQLLSDSFLRILMDLLVKREVTSTQKFHDLICPSDVKYRQLLFVGPPGVGKSAAIQCIRAWPEEGNIDLSLPGWWRSQTLAIRPRELHLLMPFSGLTEGMAVFDPSIIQDETPRGIDFSRVLLPPPKKGLFSKDWKKRYTFDFILPEPEQVFEWRQERAKRGTHPGDMELTFDTVRKQCVFFEQIAQYLHLKGLSVVTRKGWHLPPLRYSLSEEEAKIADEATTTSFP